MKRRFSKILGVGLTLALVTSLLLTAAPVSALSEAIVTVDPTTISAVDADYTIRFQLDKELYGRGTVVGGTAPGNFTLPDVGDEFTIAYGTLASNGVITVVTGAIAVVPVDDATYNSVSGAWTITDAGDAVVITATAFDTTGAWTMPTGNATASVTADVTTDDTITITFPSGTTIDSPTATIAASQGWVGGQWVISDPKTPTWSHSDTERTITVTLDDLDAKIGEGATVRIAITAGITNPDNAGDYNLTVETSQEDAEPSADYEITVPDIGVLPGIVQQYNAADPPILMAQDTGDDAIKNMVDSAGVDYTIVVGPGKYEIEDTIVINQEGLTLESSGDTEDTIIDADAHNVGTAIQVAADDVTVDGFTIDFGTFDGDSGISVPTAADATVQNNIITEEEGYVMGITLGVATTGATISGNELDIKSTMYVQGSGHTLSDNTFGAGINLAGDTSEITITENEIIGSELEGIHLGDSGSHTDILIEGNTISETTEGDAIGIFIRGIITNLQILDNDITDNEGVGILIDSGVTIAADSDSAIAIKFNTITGNDADNDGYGIQNDDAAADGAGGNDTVDATFNWWGTAVGDDIAAMVNDTTDNGVTTYEPFLADTAEAVFSASDVAVGATSIAKDTADIAVSVTLGDGGDAVNVISVAKYIANPQEAIADAIAFYDVYVAGTLAHADTEATIKFYAGDTNTEVYIWSADTLTWGKIEEPKFSAYGGYVWVVIEDPAMLAGTPFALVAGEAEAIESPKILAPTVGADDVSLSPTLAWGAVDEAIGYDFELADNANFVVPLVKLDGELGRLIVTAYAYAGKLDYSAAYYWRVKAVSTTGESAWVTGVFYTVAEPEEPEAPVWMCSEGLTFTSRAALKTHLATAKAHKPVEPPEIIVEPDVEVIVPLPAETPITPAWIYVIIAVGAVLVIALIVLIVRTRRVA